MTMVVFSGASGAPGVTLTALGVTLVWQRDVLLVDANRTRRSRCWPGTCEVSRSRARDCWG